MPPLLSLWIACKSVSRWTYLDLIVACKHDVCRLEVQMSPAPLCHVVQGTGNVTEHLMLLALAEFVLANTASTTPKIPA